MKRTAVSMIISFILLSRMSAQFPESPNKTNADSKREGQWTVLFGKDWQLTNDSVQVSYYRIVSYKNGKPEGRVNDYYRSGKKQWEGFLLSENPDVLDGSSIFYNENGNKEEEGTYASGNPVGKWTSFYDNGRKKEEGNYANGKKDGVWTYWSRDGFEVKRQVFKDDVAHDTKPDPQQDVSNAERILKTTDGGTTWTPIDAVVEGKSISVYSMCFIDSRFGWAAGNSIYRTTDGGVTWSDIYQSSNTTAAHFSVFFGDSMNGTVVGDFLHPILSTTNGGSTWNAPGVKVGFEQHLEAVYYYDSNNGWAVGFHGTVMHTANGGKEWEYQVSNVSEHLNAIQFTSSKNGWAVGALGNIIHTSDGGNTWERDTIKIQFMGMVVPIRSFTDYLVSVFFVDSRNGWVLSQDGNVLSTRDGGRTWSIQRLQELQDKLLQEGVLISLFRIYFVGKDIGWICGDQGTVMKTTNGGTTWHKQESGTRNRLRGILFVDERRGWAW